jgi:predicted O-methyltransferase YrrM
VHYTDNSPERARDAKKYIARAGVSRRIHIHVGDALDSFRQTKGMFDMIFCDGDKTGYPAALRLALPRLRTGGLLVADNVLWRGRVAEASSDETTRAIQEFNRRISGSRDLFTVIVPLRDGVAVCRKG